MTVATFVLIHGGGDVRRYWHLVERELRQRGHDTLAPDLPCDDDSAGLAEYADIAVKAIGGPRVPRRWWVRRPGPPRPSSQLLPLGRGRRVKAREATA